jgi:sugar O-acyltransferase (sialic acid O-acetyltransferase NeuD family)
METKNLILIGGGGHCKSCIDVIESVSEYKIAGIIDLPQNVGNLVLGYPIIGTNDDLPDLVSKGFYFLITVGNIGAPLIRIELYILLQTLRGKLATVISSTALVSKYAKIGAGTIIMHHAVVNASAEVGNNCIINTKALIEHDAVIGDHCHISTGSIVNGGTIVGSQTFFGSGAVSKQYITIPEGSFIKANSIVK